MRYGIIYIAHNPRDGETIFKVGKTERSIYERMKELTASTSNLGTYKARAFFVVFDIDAAEKACHERLNQYRIQKNREFFDIHFSRLLRIVREQVAQYSARDFVPDVLPGIPENITLADNPSEILAKEKIRQEQEAELWDTVLTNEKITLIKWADIIRARFQEARSILSQEDILKWEAFDNTNVNHTSGKYTNLFSVTVLSRFTKPPLELSLSGYRGESYGPLDLSQATGEPEIWRHRNPLVQYLKWKEVDDGRIGQITIMMGIKNSDQASKESNIIPSSVIVIRANAIKYSQNFEEKDIIERKFHDPEESFEIFLALIVANCAKPQYDVRTQIGETILRSGRRIKKVLDMGIFDCSILR